MSNDTQISRALKSGHASQWWVSPGGDTVTAGVAAPSAGYWTVSPMVVPSVRVDSWSDDRTPGANAVPDALDNATRIARLRAESGLTTDQIARLMGVSRRAVHKWLNGGSMAAVHEERLHTILGIVNSLPGDAPHQRRAALLEATPGPSLFASLLRSAPEPARILAPGLGVRDRISL